MIIRPSQSAYIAKAKRDLALSILLFVPFACILLKYLLSDSDSQNGKLFTFIFASASGIALQFIIILFFRCRDGNVESDWFPMNNSLELNEEYLIVNSVSGKRKFCRRYRLDRMKMAKIYYPYVRIIRNGIMLDAKEDFRLYSKESIIDLVEIMNQRCLNTRIPCENS